MLAHFPLRCATMILAIVLVACHGNNQNTPSNLRANQFSKLPDWSGIWISAGTIGNLSIDGYPPDDFLQTWQMFRFTAPYNVATKAKLTELMKVDRRPSKSDAWGFPFMMESPTPLQFTVTPEETLIITFYRDIRHIYTDGRPLPAAQDRWPAPWGESVGHWEEDVLVVRTVSVERPGFIPALLLISSEAEYTERIRKVSQNRIESELTITDPTTLTEPWVIKLGYKRAEGLDRMFHNRFDNDRSVLDDSGKAFTIADTAK